MAVFVIIKNFFEHLINIVYPAFCPICKKRLFEIPAPAICPVCVAAMPVNASPLCPACGRTLTHNLNHVCLCKKNRQILFFDRALSVCDYTGTAKICIQLFKYTRRKELGRPLAEKMHLFLRDHVNTSEIDCIIPVPLHRSKLRERGFNQARVLTELLAAELGCGCVVDNLVRVRRTKSQFSLSREERSANVSGVFSCRNPELINGQTILLVDDIFTTGATANECARVLKEAGARRIIAFSMARS